MVLSYVIGKTFVTDVLLILSGDGVRGIWFDKYVRNIFGLHFEIEKKNTLDLTIKQHGWI